jgi:polyphosphate kinase
VLGYKTHAKVSLVVRQEPDGVRTYVHLATGNYNTDTAELYTDIGLFSCDPGLGSDTAQLFNLLTSGHIGEQRFEKLVIAPITMRRRILALIEREAEHQRRGGHGRIVAKMNSLEDPAIVRALYDASRAGVEIDLIVRGVCRLRPGVPGMSESIRVRSVVGRFLEHARIFHFGNDGEDEFYIASADWMSRNLDYRVETMVPVESPELRSELRWILDVQLADNRKAWELEPDGSWRMIRPGPDEPERSSQAIFMESSLRRRSRP